MAEVLTTFNGSTHIHADFTQRAVVLPDEYQWTPSPTAGVERMMLDRVGGEVARATTIVRFEPNSEFPRHIHGGGEEFLVLEGAFADEHGVYPKGYYLRNPIGTAHTPRIGPEGATIFVKLHQFADSDTSQISLDTNSRQWLPGLVDGLSVMPLHQHEGEHVALVKWQPNTQFSFHQHRGGEEILVLEGTFYDEHGVYPKGSWLRSPNMSSHTPFTKEDGALIYVKVGHLDAVKTTD
ncbi:cupin domain-containing protein [Sessilibacter corallicola]|uniref:Cupin domain-containing protein n=1 Tax=Sessilibacter corallicola TaxID=2904075 RepID=A0ABQ0AEM9_9GAMM